MPAGRPLKFKTVEELQGKIDAYFASCYTQKVDENGIPVLDLNGNPVLEQVEPITITGLALALDTSREVLMDIQNQVSEGYSKEYSDAIIRAKLRCQNYAEKQMFTAKSANGPIFALKNYGWVDKQEIVANVTAKSDISEDELDKLIEAKLSQRLK